MAGKLDENSRADPPAPSGILPEVERRISDDQLPEAFRRLPEAVRKETVRKVSVTAIEASVSSWESDDYPPPAILEEYERVSPGFSQKIIAMAENELAHSQKMELRVAQYFSRGQWMGFILAFIVVTGSIWLISIGKETAGGLLAGAVVVPLIAMFIRGQLNLAGLSGSNHPAEAGRVEAPPAQKAAPERARKSDRVRPK